MESKKTRAAASAEQATSQSERATLALREMLAQGHFRPGERMREVPLAKQLGVSRIPLRLALERLAHEGFLEMRPTRGFVAQQFEIGDIYDSIDLRGAIEGMAARYAAERSNKDEVAKLWSIHEQMARLVRNRRLTLECVTHYIALNAEFHDEVLRLARSRQVQRAMEQAVCLPFASPNAFVRRQYMEQESHDLFLISVEHHRAIAEAIELGESARAENVAREHARVARRNLDSALANRNLAEVVPALKLIKL
jgi:GntR family transcriptional regulator of vanillate catabolism